MLVVVVLDTVPDQFADAELVLGSIQGDQVVPVLAVARRARQDVA